MGWIGFLDVFLPSPDFSLGELSLFIFLSESFTCPLDCEPTTLPTPPSHPEAVSSLLRPLELDIRCHTEGNFLSHLSLKSRDHGEGELCSPAEDKTLFFHSELGLLGRQ